MGTLRHLQHWLIGRGPQLLTTEFVPETHAIRLWADPFPWEALVQAVEQSLAQRCPKKRPQGGRPRARSRTLGLGLEAGAQWQHGLAPPQTLAAEPPPLQEGLETIAQMRTQDTEPAPGGGPGARRRTQHGAADRRLSIEEHDRRHGRTRSAKTCNGFTEPLAVDVASKGSRDVVGRPAKEPEQAAVALLAEAWENTPGLLQRAIDLGAMARPRLAQGEAPGVDRIARPWPHVGPLCTTKDFPLDCARMHVTCPGGQSVPMVPGTPAQCPAAVCDGGAWRASGPKPRAGQGEACASARMRGASRSGEPRGIHGVDGPRSGSGRWWSTRLRIHGATKAVAPATKACARTSVMAVVMRRSATSRSRHIMRSSIDSLPEISPN